MRIEEALDVICGAADARVEQWDLRAGGSLLIEDTPAMQAIYEASPEEARRICDSQRHAIAFVQEYRAWLIQQPTDEEDR